MEVRRRSKLRSLLSLSRSDLTSLSFMSFCNSRRATRYWSKVNGWFHELHWMKIFHRGCFRSLNSKSVQNAKNSPIVIDLTVSSKCANDMSVGICSRA